MSYTPTPIIVNDELKFHWQEVSAFVDFYFEHGSPKSDLKKDDAVLALWEGIEETQDRVKSGEQDVSDLKRLKEIFNAAADTQTKTNKLEKERNIANWISGSLAFVTVVSLFPAVNYSMYWLSIIPAVATIIYVLQDRDTNTELKALQENTHKNIEKDIEFIGANITRRHDVFGYYYKG